MTLRLETLEWSGYFSYGEDNFIDFTADTVTQILGVNGHGKSSIPLILEEVLYNKNSKGIAKADIPNRYLDGRTWAKLSFNSDGEDYTLEVERKSSIKVKLYKNGVDISSHTATETFKTVERLIGADFKTGSQLIYQSPTSSLNFLTATDTTRKKFLIDILKLEPYVERFEVFKEAAKEVTKTVTGIEASIATIENWLKTNSNIDLTPIEKLPSPAVTVLEDEKQIAGLTTAIDNIVQTNRKRSQNTKFADLMKKIPIEELQAIVTTEFLSYDKEQGELGALNNEIKQRSAQATKLSKLGDACPTCEQTIESSFKQKLIEEEEEAIEIAKSKANALQACIDAIKANNLLHQKKVEGIREWENLFQSYDPNIPEELEDKNELQEKVNLLEERIANAKAELRRVEAHNSNADKHNSKIQVISEQIIEFQKQLDEKSKSLEEERHNLSNLEILKKAFSTNGLIAYKIENQVKELEDIANGYLAELSDGRFTIAFSVVSDKLNVDLTDNGQSINIAALSSGELARVNTATLLALRKMMNTLSKSKINVLFLDEVISVLDDQGKEKLVEILLEEEDLNTYLVSHSWSHPLLAKLEVIKENNISRIEYA